MTTPRTSTRGSHPVPRETLDRALALVRSGMTMAEAADALGYSSPLTLSTWRKRYPWFAPALVEARAEGMARRKGPRAALAVLRRVRAGETQRAAAAAEGVAVATIGGWNRRIPGYRAALTAAMYAGRVGQRSRVARRKADVLTWIGKGRSVVDACARAGCTDADVSRWRRSDPGFTADYDRLVGPTRHPRGRAKFHRLLERIRAGETVWHAAVAVRLGPSVPTLWRQNYPELWAEVVRAYVEAGRTPPQQRRRVA